MTWKCTCCLRVAKFLDKNVFCRAWGHPKVYSHLTVLVIQLLCGSLLASSIKAHVVNRPLWLLPVWQNQATLRLFVLAVSSAEQRTPHLCIPCIPCSHIFLLIVPSNTRCLQWELVGQCSSAPSFGWSMLQMCPVHRKLKYLPSAGRFVLLCPHRSTQVPSRIRPVLLSLLLTNWHFGISCPQLHTPGMRSWNLSW